VEPVAKTTSAIVEKQDLPPGTGEAFQRQSIPAIHQDVRQIVANPVGVGHDR
jgi:hypothetical protein